MRCSIPGAGRCAIGKLNASAVGDSGGVMWISWNGMHPVLSLLKLIVDAKLNVWYVLVLVIMCCSYNMLPRLLDPCALPNHLLVA